MPTELETIAAAVARSEATSEKTLALVQTLATKLENIRATTNDPSTAAQLLALATSLNAESDKVDAADAAGEAAGALASPADTTSAGGTTDVPPTPADPGAPPDPNAPSTAPPPEATGAAAPVADPES